MECLVLLSEKPKSITMLSMVPPFHCRVLIAFIFITLIGAACAAPTTVPAPPTELVAPLPTLSAATETVVPIETATEPVTPTPQPQPGLERPRYVLDLRLNFTTKVATVDQTI